MAITTKTTATVFVNGQNIDLLIANKKEEIKMLERIRDNGGPIIEGPQCRVDTVLI